jgi:hypothetical protein
MNKYEINMYTIKELENEILIDILNNNLTRTDWLDISCCQNLTEEFIEKYNCYLNWFWMSRYQKLSENFIEKHKDKVDWDGLLAYQKLSYEFKNKNSDKN